MIKGKQKLIFLFLFIIFAVTTCKIEDRKNIKEYLKHKKGIDSFGVFHHVVINFIGAAKRYPYPINPAGYIYIKCDYNGNIALRNTYFFYCYNSAKSLDRKIFHYNNRNNISKIESYNYKIDYMSKSDPINNLRDMIHFIDTLDAKGMNAFFTLDYTMNYYYSENRIDSIKKVPNRIQEANCIYRYFYSANNLDSIVLTDMATNEKRFFHLEVKERDIKGKIIKANIVRDSQYYELTYRWIDASGECELEYQKKRPNYIEKYNKKLVAVRKYKVKPNSNLLLTRFGYIAPNDIFIFYDIDSAFFPFNNY